MKVVQYIFNEKAWGNSLAYNQTVKQCILCSKLDKSIQYEIRILVPLFNLFAERKEIRRLKSQSSNNLKISCYPTFFLFSRLFLMRPWVICLFLLTAMPYALLFYAKLLCGHHSEVWHFRSYPISLLLCWVQTRRLKKIFDPRSDYILENTRRGVWREGSLTQRFWYWAESLIMNQVDHVIVVSHAMKDQLQQRCRKLPRTPMTRIHNCVDTQRFHCVRTETKAPYTLLYSGSLGNWNKLETYLNFFERFHTQYPNSTLIIASPMRGRRLITTRAHIETYEKIKDHIELISPVTNHTTDTLPTYYERAQFGLQLMDEIDNRVGVKFVEYLASGLLPVVNEQVLGAAEFCREYDVGFILKDNCSTSDIHAMVRALDAHLKSRNWQIAKTEIDENKTASDYYTLYLSLLRCAELSD